MPRITAVLIPCEPNIHGVDQVTVTFTRATSTIAHFAIAEFRQALADEGIGEFTVSCTNTEGQAS